MLNFDEERFIRIQSGATALIDPIGEYVTSLATRGIDNVFFLGTGGAAILMELAAQLLEQGSTLAVFRPKSAELVLAGSRHLGPRSLVVIPSLSGTTAESVRALDWCRERGATIMSLVGHAGTPLAERADRTFVNFAEDDTSCESFYVQSLAIALALMAVRGEYRDHAATFRELRRLPDLLLVLKRSFEPEAGSFAEAIDAAPWHIIAGAGMTWPAALYYGMCILEEMQWIRTRPVHASDFFHGTLELVEKDVSLILLKGEDAARPLVERVERFAAGVTSKVAVLDAAAFDLPGLSPTVRALISPILLATVLERVSAHLEVRRDHPLTTRRYYRRMAY